MQTLLAFTRLHHESVIVSAQAPVGAYCECLQASFELYLAQLLYVGVGHEAADVAAFGVLAYPHDIVPHADMGHPVTMEW